MHLSNINNTYRPNFYRPNFGATDDECEQFALDNFSYFRKNIGDPAYKAGIKWGNTIGMLFAVIASLITGATVKSCDDESNAKEKADIMNKFSTLLNSNDIKHDTFTVKDVNDDDMPDIILYRQDGTEVVFDINNNKVLEGKKIHKTEYTEINK